MNPAADRLWSAQQQTWLGALGHTVYLPADWPTEAGDTASVEADSAPERRPMNPGTTPAATRASRAPAPAPADDAPRRERTAPIPRGAGSRLPDRLHFALIRASGCNPNAPGATEIIAQWPPSAQLRGNAAAKRALWPALRRLRRTTTP